MKNVTIKDVAKAAGVSPSTVSRVISDSDRISAETKELVRRTMKELGYHHNAIARSLVTQKTDTIGLVMARPTQQAFANPFFSGIIQGIAGVTQEKHYSLILSSTGDYREEQEETLKLFRNRRVDGVILMSSRRNDELIEKLIKSDYPFVLIGRSPDHEGIPIVNNDNIKDTYASASFLLKRGYKKVVALSGPEEYIVSQDRAQGYMQALQEHGDMEPEFIFVDDFKFEAAYEGILDYLQENEKDFDAILAFDDMLALGAMRAIQEQGLRIPEDVGIMGFNDEPMLTYLKPALSTVRLPIQRMGEEAARMLIKMLNEKGYKGEEIILPTELIIRDTV
ncbi:MAG: LacI family DNA-binding transcriptional regulator [Bacillota bacterium]|jgi:DNA-binding LacI/PurR family transcriptional regulator|nr:LacI family DNA-binding transcriptional regulator [Bacillota bacterium]